MKDNAPFLSRLGFLVIQKIKELAGRLVKQFDVRARSINVPASTLSGGYQQKLILARELDEIYALSDRIVTLYEGRITGEYPPDARPEDIGVGMLGGDEAREAS